MQEARNGMAAAVIEHKIYVFSGAGGTGGGTGGPPPNGGGNNQQRPPDLQRDSSRRSPPGIGPQQQAGPSPIEVFSEQ